MGIKGEKMELMIGGHKYAVVEMKNQTQDGKDLLGLHDAKTCTISLDGDMAETRKHETLLHEVLHVILTNAGFQNHEEHLIDAMSNGLLQVGVGEFIWKRGLKS